MKKVLFVLLAVLLIAMLCLSGCNGKSVEQVDQLLKKEYSSLAITVVSASGNGKLTATFQVTVSGDTSTVVFSIEQWQTLDLEGDNPANAKKTLQGSVTVKDNQIISQTGDALGDVELEEILPYRMHFSTTFLSKVRVKNNILTAKVKNPQGFLANTEFKCKKDSMTVKVSFTADAIQKIVVDYTSTSGNKVTSTYEFTV